MYMYLLDCTLNMIIIIPVLHVTRAELQLKQEQLEGLLNHTLEG